MIKVLDCTLRDGGYINDWMFGRSNIDYILKHLDRSELDIIEVGYLSDKITDENSTIYQVENVAKVLDKCSARATVMINYGEVDIEKLQISSGLFGIRVAFHKVDMNDALEYCQKLIDIGYDVYIQPMYTMAYGDEEYLQMIDRVNKMKPKAIYIVDSFGDMDTVQVRKYFNMLERKLDKDISIGLHCHNNMNLAQMNAIWICEVRTEHNVIIDASVKGMGRGAGNLETEFLCMYINENIMDKYNLVEIEKVKTRIIRDYFKENPWGFSEEYYYSAINHCHPFYAKYLQNQENIDINDVRIILGRLSEGKKRIYDEEYIKEEVEKYCEKKL